MTNLTPTNASHDSGDIENADEVDDEDEVEELDMDVFEITTGELTDGYLPLTLATSRGEIACRFYAPHTPDAPQSTSAEPVSRAVIWVGGVGGGFDSPAHDLYPRLCTDLQAQGIASLRIKYRQPTNLEECALDTFAGLGLLENQGMSAISLVGHSLGGAVVIQAGTASDAVCGVVTLAAQSYGAADVVAELPDECAILLAHGKADPVLPPQASEYVYSLAHEPRRLLLFEDAGHGLDEVADEVTRVVREFLLERLGA